MYDYKSPQVVVKSSMSFTSAATILTYSIERSSDVYSLRAVVYTAPTVTATVLTYTYQPTPGSSTGAVVLGTITIPVATAIGKVVYKDIKPVSLPEGGEIIVAVSTTSTAGAGQAYIIFGEDPECNSASPNLIASA